MKILGSFLTAFAVCFLITPILIFFLKKLDVIDSPGGRKIHSNKIPSMGGLGFVIATLFSLFIWMDYSQLLELRFILAALSLMLFVGIRDDLVNLTAWQKLASQLVATFIVVVMADVRITGLYGLFGVYDLPLVLSYGLSFFTVIVLTNAFNLIDGLDGLAGTVSVIAFTFLSWWFYSVGQTSFAILSLTLTGGVLSFLIFNWHPAKVFMGDTGSLCLGFALATLVIHFIDMNGHLLDVEGLKFRAPIAAGIALVIIPLYDTARVFFRRASNGKSPMAPDKSHVHHFLMRGGLRHDQVSLLLGFISISFIALSVLGSGFSDYVMIPALVLLAVLLGYRLDSVTLKRVRKRSKQTASILAKNFPIEPLLNSQDVEPETKESKPRRRTRIKSKILENIKLSDN
ncbi:glycosyltransferase family 4 protein [Mongoliibacter ruber]|uniref:UDP-N-acetylmuramyl pentapeptide phosphotransferase/UDP-N-acetylglucosamine-1-phosphate transferase n=1 Tax=Mongoliibacter ruber TaxID=1750599 RepID=A0A2T0WNS4_9BACT|nr:MraY family glycosyltransferase [Mongoliibacter ruber]PRY88353.1 UDP-N-acetylmuramyl pentapeptide phosphotransferase/UDP-N-acetylglucosamine-1-phosphate transferase [Mongoliibacter ruber]